MTDSINRTLAWLTAPPADFNKQVAGLDVGSERFVEDLRALSLHALNESQLRRIAKKLAEAHAADVSLSGVQPLRLAIISNATADYYAPVLIASALRHGFALDVHLAPYGQIMQEVLEPSSALYAFEPDIVLCALDHRGLPLQPCPGDEDEADQTVSDAMEFVAAIRKGVEQHSKAVCMMQTVARPAETLFGSLDAGLPGTWRDLVTRFNQRLGQDLRQSPHLLLDVAGIAETVGLENWHNVQLWNIGKVAFSTDYLPLFGDHVARLIGAWKGKSRRGLILDLDNTTWGGVIGDDGINGIRIAEGDAIGEAHRELQRAALSLRERGIVVAICSKNDDEVARGPFKSSPEMLLREEHIAVFQANWRDKATNIQAISDELSLGLDAFVFLDDNPMERDIVRTMLRGVAVPELPADAAHYARLLFASGLFEAVVFSEEDKKRAADYQNNARRLALRQSVGNVDDYLKSLEMEITFRPFDRPDVARIAQLINKSNQFNLTTRRYSDDEVMSFAANPDNETFQVRLKDKFGDNGMISVIICKTTGKKTWEIDTWLMSCRVLGRKVEQAVLENIRHHAREAGVEKLVGVYRPTERNSMVADHYGKLGFTKTDTLPDGTIIWELDIRASSDVKDLPMVVVDQRAAFA